MTDAHQTNKLGELVCSNSFRSDDFETNAVGLLHQELRLSNSLIMKCADKCKIPAGSALAVDREKFSSLVTKHLNSHKLIFNMSLFPPRVCGMNEVRMQIMILCR